VATRDAAMNANVSSHVDAHPTCCFAYDPILRPHCEHRAVVAYGPTALCSSCDARRSTMGKGIAGRSLVHGRDWSALEAVEAAVTQLNAAEEHLASIVAAARGSGYSWGELGDALGVTRQAAQQRFGRIRGLWKVASPTVVDNTRDGGFFGKRVDTEGVLTPQGTRRRFPFSAQTSNETSNEPPAVPHRDRLRRAPTLLTPKG
jgi:hypothetical protein